MTGPSRSPYANVKRILRREVGFQCPVRDCGNPYLTWHHFDPPWREEHHHRPEGMIALCLEHASKADHGAFTDDQLRALRKKHPERNAVCGRFDWRRQELLVRLGGGFYYKTSTILQLGDTPCVWLSRDTEGLLEVNFRIPSTSGNARASVIENFWTAPQSADEIICPPMGRLVDVRYRNGDRFKMHFKNIARPEHVVALYPKANIAIIAGSVSFPTTLVEITSKTAGTPIEFEPNTSRMGGLVLREFFSMGSGRTAIHLEMSRSDVQRLLPDMAEG